jgi:hypothetical protein
MATDLQNFTTAINALVDGVATVAQRTTIGDAFVAELADDEITAKFPNADPPATRANLTNEQRAKVVNDALKVFIRTTVRRMKVKAARDAAGAAAAAEPDPL